MKLIDKWYVSLALVLFSFTSAFACYFEPCEKTYVNQHSTAVTGKGIFVKINEQWFQTEALFSDGEGVFIRNLNPSGYGCPDPYNACRNCMRCVHEIYDICPYCHKPT